MPRYLKNGKVRLSKKELMELIKGQIKIMNEWKTANDIMQQRYLRQKELLLKNCIELSKSEGVYFCLNNDYRTINHFVTDTFGEQGVYDDEKLVLVKTENDKYFLNKDYLDWRWNYDEQHFFNLFRN